MNALSERVQKKEGLRSCDAVDELCNYVNEFLSPYLCGYRKGFNT